MRLIDRDIEILDTLATKVRLLSVPQIADAWWPDRASGKSQAVRRLRQLKAAGLIDEQTIHAYPPISLTEPVATWAPGGPEPDCEAISYRLQSRWSGSPRLTPVYTASEQTARMMAMDNATKSAKEMLDELTLRNNQARQARITSELTEIVNGANTISEGY